MDFHTTAGKILMMCRIVDQFAQFSLPDFLCFESKDEQERVDDVRFPGTVRSDYGCE